MVFLTEYLSRPRNTTPRAQPRSLLSAAADPGAGPGSPPARGRPDVTLAMLLPMGSSDEDLPDRCSVRNTICEAAYFACWSRPSWWPSSRAGTSWWTGSPGCSAADQEGDLGPPRGRVGLGRRVGQVVLDPALPPVAVFGVL